MKQSELLEHSTCNLCRRKIGESGLPLFWRVTVERFGVDVKAVRRQDGLGAFLGSGALAEIMGPDEDLATPVMDPAKLVVCETCAVELQLCVAMLPECASQWNHNGAIFEQQAPTPSPTEARAVPSARPLEWERDSYGQWVDTHHGFSILLEEGDDEPYSASWGEGDSAQFASLEKAQAWCQQQLDDWVSRHVVLSATPVQGKGEG